jgi:hypothetical protein
LAKIYGTAAFAVSAACGGALERKIGGIERRHADSPMIMPAIGVRSYVGAVGCGSALERTAVALDHTRTSVQTKNVAETAN